jgi:hypothetical protein
MMMSRTPGGESMVVGLKRAERVVSFLAASVAKSFCRMMLRTNSQHSQHSEHQHRPSWCVCAHGRGKLRRETLGVGRRDSAGRRGHRCDLSRSHCTVWPFPMLISGPNGSLPSKPISRCETTTPRSSTYIYKACTPRAPYVHSIISIIIMHWLPPSRAHGQYASGQP